MNAFDATPLTMFRPASVEALLLDHITWLLIGGAVALLAVMSLLLALALRRHSRPIAAAWWIVGGGLGVPAVLLTTLFLYSVSVTQGLDRARPPDALIVDVVGRMWWWEIHYPDTPGPGRVTLANEIRVPVGRQVLLSLGTADVIHSFWVPAVGGKMDTVPGRDNRLLFTPREPGTYRGICAEYCGTQHARMGLTVVVQTPAEFDAWLERQARDAIPPDDEAARRGRQVFLSRGCDSCHAIRGVAERGRLGPDLTHVASRLELGAGTLRNDHGALARWITTVQDLKPGARMPATHHLIGRDLDDLVAYLEHLR
ncbi:MAG: c-type cytochrome [Burkholderiales bacterium]|nr:c-type cytochrome [Burkholderiales bacterium]